MTSIKKLVKGILVFLATLIILSLSIVVAYCVMTLILPHPPKLLNKLSYLGFSIELGLMSCLFIGLFLLTKRYRLALILSIILYAIFLISTSIKSLLLGVPIYPKDFILLGDLFKAWHSLIPYLPATIGLIVAVVIYIAWEIRSTPPKKIKHSIKALTLMSLVIVCLINLNHERIRLYLTNNSVYHKKNANLVKRGFKYGFLTNFFQALLFQSKQLPPKGYSNQKISEIVNKYRLDELNKITPTQARYDNVIVLMIESFTDPKQFGWKFNFSPTPHFDQLTKNSLTFAISPVFGGKSINAEFELMTGLSYQFTPVESTPYHEFITAPIHSLARTFKQNNYTTNVIHAVKFSGFGYGKIYEFLGMDNKISLSIKNDGVKADPSGRSTAKEEFTNKIISLTESQDKSFIFAFPNSSHSPWSLSHYPHSKLRLINKNTSEDTKNQVLAYANAINYVDQMIGSLINYYEKSQEKTLIVLVGDHQPGLSVYLNNKPEKSGASRADKIVRKYTTGFAVWSNSYPVELPDNLVSINLIPAWIVKQSRINSTGFIKFINHFSNYVSVLSHSIIKQKQHDFHMAIPDEIVTLIEDYEMLQYDILFGKNHLERILKNAAE